MKEIACPTRKLPAVLDAFSFSMEQTKKRVQLGIARAGPIR